MVIVTPAIMFLCTLLICMTCALVRWVHLAVLSLISVLFCAWCTQVVSAVLLFSQHVAIGAGLITDHKAAPHVSAPHQQIPTVLT